MGKIRGKNLIKIFTRPNNGDKAEVSLIRSRVNESNERRERWNIPIILYLPSFTSSTNSIRLSHFRVLSSINDTCLPPFSTGKPRETLSPPSSSDVINSACPSRRWHTIVYHPRGWNKSPFRISSSPRCEKWIPRIRGSRWDQSYLLISWWIFFSHYDSLKGRARFNNE